jgi:polyhydroxyalkanoate synthesis regulator phasin
MQRRRRAKTRRPKLRFGDRSLLEKDEIAQLHDIVKKTLSRLHGLGNQIFGVFPFGEYFDDWLVNLRGVLSDFELNSAITLDNQFDEECSKILANLELVLEEKRRKEASYDLAMKSLSADRRLLERIDEDYTVKTRELERRKNSEIKRLSKTVQDLKEELDRITQMKTGIFRSMSKRAKAEKKAEAVRILNFAQDKLKLVEPKFSAEEERLIKEHTKTQQPIVERIQNLRQEVDSMETDSSLDARRAACEALVDAVNALLKRKMLLLQ